MDDDCDRGMYRAYHMLLALIDYEQSPFSSTSMFYKQTNYLWLNSLNYFVTEDIKRNAQCKEAIHECESHTKTIEIQYKQEENSSKTVLTRVNFPYSSQVKILI